MLQDFSHNLDVALCLRSEQFNPLLRCCSLKNPTSYKSCIFHIPKANHLKARSGGFSTGCWQKKAKIYIYPISNTGNIMQELPVQGMGDVPGLCHLQKTHLGSYYLHDNCLYVLIICCVPKHSLWKRLNNRSFSKQSTCNTSCADQSVTPAISKPIALKCELSRTFHRCLCYLFKMKEFKDGPKYLLTWGLYSQLSMLLSCLESELISVSCICPSGDKVIAFVLAEVVFFKCCRD